MILTADYHTHTPYSHGKGTVEENAARAKELGLKQIGITDHGFSHIAFGLRRKRVPALIAECRAASEKLGIDVLVGMESNIRGVSGLTDLTERDYENFDLFICGKHVFIAYETFGDWWHYFGGNFTVDKFGRRPPKALVERNTRAYINMIKKKSRGHRQPFELRVPRRRGGSGEVCRRLRDVYRTEFQKGAFDGRGIVRGRRNGRQIRRRFGRAFRGQGRGYEAGGRTA
ncbi:MAG: PHP domain-containing protein, partial [Firmicutes bacterium]|nr:PHP domain-containing protein [Bacillota bacterium]